MAVDFKTVASEAEARNIYAERTDIELVFGVLSNALFVAVEHMRDDALYHQAAALIHRCANAERLTFGEWIASATAAGRAKNRHDKYCGAHSLTAEVVLTPEQFQEFLARMADAPQPWRANDGAAN